MRLMHCERCRFNFESDEPAVHCPQCGQDAVPAEKAPHAPEGAKTRELEVVPLPRGK
jgi:hypothetical protein